MSYADPVIGVFEDEIEPLGFHGDILLIDPPQGLQPLFTGGDRKVSVWNRFAYRGQSAQAWIPDGPFDAVVIRIANDRLSLEMLIHAAAAHIKKTGEVFVYGMNDEGMKSTNHKLEPFFKQIETRVTKRHARVVSAKELLPNKPLKGKLSDWKESVPEAKKGQVILAPHTYPGIFAHGRIDPGTRLLLNNLPTPKPGASVLDYGCGNGILSDALIHTQPDLRIDMLDIYALAVEAAKQNVPSATAIISDGLAAVAGRKYDLIISNPPVHRGKDQHVGMLEAFIHGSKKHLNPGGELRVVVQRTLPIKEAFKDSGYVSKSIAQDTVYEVWSALGRES